MKLKSAHERKPDNELGAVRSTDRTPIRIRIYRAYSFGRYFFNSNGVTCLRYSSHS